MVSRIIKILICIVTVKMVCVQNVSSSSDDVEFYDPDTGLPVSEEFVTGLGYHDGNVTDRPGSTTIGENGLSCVCIGFTCSCCAGIKISAINLDKKACMKFGFMPNDLALRLIVEWNQNEVYNKQVSVKNPPPVCISVPGFSSVTFCTRLVDVSMVQNKLHLCVDFELDVAKKAAAVLHFKCLDIGARGHYCGSPIYANELPPLPETEEHIVSDQYDVSFYEPQTGIPFLGELMREPVYYYGNGTDLAGLPTYGLNGLSCKCSGFDCSCCAGIKIKKFNIDKTACFKFTYIPTELAMKMSLLWNDKEIYNKQVSVRNPPALCLSIPYVPLAKFCVRFSEVSIKNNVLRTCIDFEVQIATKRILKLHFKCVQLGTKGLFWDTGSCPYAISSEQGTDLLGVYNEVLLELLDQEELPAGASMSTLPPKEIVKPVV